MLDAVRNRVLDLALALRRENPEGLTSTNEASTVPADKVTQIFNTTVLGGSANIVGTATNSEITFGITKGEFESLAEYFRKLRVDELDLEALKKAVDEDPKPQARGQLGSRVSAWVGKMLAKAASGAWQIGLSSASALLVEAIERFYGL